MISEKHRGATTAENLAYACVFCNRAKGSDIGSLAESGQYTRFYNPRSDRWSEHFSLSGVKIAPRSPIGEATARILNFNTAERLLERQALVQKGRYPSKEARTLIEANA